MVEESVFLGLILRSIPEEHIYQI